MPSDHLSIQHVSDTAIWVAYFRGIEADQTKPLFHDPLAKILVGDRGKKIAEHMITSRYVQWSVVIRTHIIDRYLQKLIEAGIDTVINIGAGLDTRPYRLDLPGALRWVEIDFPHLIEYKEKMLHQEKSRVQLERIPLDLSDRKQRKEIFVKLGAQSKKVLILSEGVIPYLTETQVGELAEDLFAEKSFHYWIAEYFSSQVYRHLKGRKRAQQMKNAPFRFFPQDWFSFFKNYGWKPQEICYFGEESQKLNRQMPLPWWGFLLRFLMSKKNAQKFQQQMGYVVFTKNES